MFRVGLRRAGLGHSLRAGLRSPLMATALNAAAAATSSAVERAACGSASSLSALSAANSASGSGVGMGVAFGVLNGMHVRWATKKAAGSSSNKKDSPGKHLGIKEFGGAWVQPGSIIVRQRGTKWHAGMNVSLGKDHTISSLIAGHVRFTHTERPWRHGKSKYRTWVSVVPHGQDPAILRAFFDANQQRYARILSDKYMGVPRSVWAPRERAAALIARDALQHATEQDAARRRLASVAFVAAAAPATTAADSTPAPAFAVPHLSAPLRAHSTVSRIRTALSVLGVGARPRKPKWQFRPATIRSSPAPLGGAPVPTVAPAAPTYVPKAVAKAKAR